MDPHRADLLLDSPASPCPLPPSHLVLLALYHDDPDMEFTPFSNFYKQHSLKRHMNTLKTWGTWGVHTVHRTANNLEIPNVHNRVSTILSEPLL